ncbi:McrB family protein [Variovorax atrisoli]|uniref:McrB family protein n=1 Tax=Variovorax atrisoli TaxID=3394203 RepID=UPI003398A33B
MKKIENEEQLKSVMHTVLEESAGNAGFGKWVDRVEAHLVAVRVGVPDRLADATFLKDLFDSPAITSTRQGNINISPAVNDPQFRRWFAERVTALLTVNADERIEALSAFFKDIKERIAPLISADTPHLKIIRALAALFPNDFTTIAAIARLAELHRALWGSRSTAVPMHHAVRKRLDALIPPLASESQEHLLARRMAIPWLLWERLSEEDSGEPGAGLAQNKIPGLSPFKGRFETVLRILPQLKNEQISQERFDELLQAGYAQPIKSTSLTTMRRAISTELDLCTQRGSTYVLSERGKRLVQTQDPDELKDHLLHRILGVDHVIRALSENPMSREEVLALLRQVRPAWTTDFIPSSIQHWLRDLDVVKSENRKLQLTERGMRWAEDITWEPIFPTTTSGSDASDTGQDDLAEAEEADGDADGILAVPHFEDLWESMQELATESEFSFPEQVVAQLHAGLWLNPTRHFAVLTGISGSGKTQLALHYALALCGDEPGDLRHIQVIAVQPGWYDQTPLLGHVSALHESVYRTTPFLELLREASANPAQPYVAILDEMNLSHPEQYMAQLLSAMEVKEHVELHSLEGESQGVPQRILYPSNLVIIGTVNMDETTHGLSDKLLDRAFTMEFMHSAIGEHKDWGEGSDLPEPLRATAKNVLVGLATALAPCRLNFGRRTEADVIGYLKMRGANDTALDEAVYAKILPKLRGEDSRLFKTALTQCLDILRQHRLTACAKKVESLQQDLVDTGSARFWR